MSEKKYSILLELQIDNTHELPDFKTLTRQINVKGLVLDEEYEPVMMSGDGNNTYVVHAWLTQPDAEKELGNHPNVVKVWMDTVIAPLEEDKDNKTKSNS